MQSTTEGPAATHHNKVPDTKCDIKTAAGKVQNTNCNPVKITQSRKINSGERHTNSHTHGEKKFCCCSTCGKLFTRQSQLTIHTRTHTGEKPYSCKMCGKPFAQKVNLHTHIRTHTGEKPYSCSTCHRSFSQQIGLTRHIRTHTCEKLYSCPTCSMQLSARSSRCLHMKKQHKQSSRDVGTSE